MNRNRARYYQIFEKSPGGAPAVTARLMHMSAYQRRQFYAARGTDPLSLERGIWWNSAGTEGVALARYLP